MPLDGSKERKVYLRKRKLLFGKMFAENMKQKRHKRFLVLGTIFLALFAPQNIIAQQKVVLSTNSQTQ